MKIQVKAIFGVVILIVSCTSKNDHSGDNSKDTVQIVQPLTPEKRVQEKVVIRDRDLNAVYLQYLQLTEALIEGRFEDAKINSNAMEAGARQIKEARTLASTAAKITTATDIEIQRRHFSTLSNEMFRLINSSGVESGTVYVDFCPMALKDKGAYWLSNEKEIRNPYFGEVMLNCGEVKKTIGQ